MGIAIDVRGQGVPIAATDQSCPDATDTPQILGYYVGVAYRALATDPPRQLPAPCLLATVAKTSSRFGDSTIAQSLSLAEALLARQPNDTGLLDTRLSLLMHLKRYGEIGAAFDRLITADSSRATREAYRSVIAAAQRGADTATMLRYLAIVTARYPAATQMTAEYEILKQVRRLRALVDTVHRAMKSDPKRLGGYASLASIYGNLGQPDSALTYLHAGMAAHVPRAEMAAPMRSIVGAILRHALIQDAADVWDATLPLALDVDSILSTPETKYLVAQTISRVVANRMDPANFFMMPLAVGHGHGTFESIDVSRVPRSSSDDACPSLAIALKLVAVASERLGSGGDQFSPTTVPAVVSGLNAIRTRLAPLARGCGAAPAATA